MKPITRYVLVVAMDLTNRFCVGITKKKGPAFLLNKLTFPGGKLEEGESAADAAKRELKEEVGIDVPLEGLSLIECVTGEGYELWKFAVVTDKVLYARQLEEEPVWHLAIDRHLEYSLWQQDAYVPDFRDTLIAALRRVGDTVTHQNETPKSEPLPA